MSMASKKHTDESEYTAQKVSGLADRTQVHQPTPPTPPSDKNRSARRLRRDGTRTLAWWKRLLGDLCILLLIAAFVGLAICGVYMFRNSYVLKPQTREIVFYVEMAGVDPNLVFYDNNGDITLKDTNIWSSDATDADCLGTIVDVQTVMIEEGEGSNTLTLYMKVVEKNALYYETKGYYCGETRLMAGMEGRFRLNGLIGDGMIIALHRPSDEGYPVTQATTNPPVSPR